MEVNGSVHKNYEKAIVNDNMKKKIAERKKLKLISLDFSDPTLDKEIKDKVEQSIKLAVPDRSHFPAYCPECHAMMALRQNKGSKVWFYACPNKHKTLTVCPDCEIEPLYNDMPDKVES